MQCRCYSLPLQRIVTDFAADAPYAKASVKIKEHYGIDIGASSIREILMTHAQCLYEEDIKTPATKAGSKTIIAEMDGGMVPIVVTDENQSDKRKGKTLLWKELKLCLAHPEGSKDPVFGGNFSGGVEKAGKQLHQCALEAGLGSSSR